MRAALLFCLVAISADAGRVYDRACDVSSRRSSRGGVYCGVAEPMFSFAPASGAGMGAACACAAVTGSRGETMTFTRASTAWCSKGGETSGIANGDLVECAIDKPRIQPGGDGTGPLGIGVSEVRTNALLQTQVFANAAWLTNGTVTVTSNAATAPDGTLTADRIVFASGLVNWVYQEVVGAGQYAGSIFLKGTSGTGGVDLTVYNNGAGTSKTVHCAYVATSWSRCVVEATPNGAGTSAMYIGGFVTAEASDFYAWGAQLEIGATVTPYITTTTVAATRAAEAASFAGIVIPTGGYGSFSATATLLAAAPLLTSRTFLTATIDASNLYRLLTPVTTGFDRSIITIAGVSSSLTGVTTMTASASNILAGYYDGTNRGTCVNSTCVTTPASLTLPSGSATVTIGGTVGAESNATNKKVCLDPNPSRCPRG